MEVLVIGGTRFIGRHFVRKLLQSGYNITLFNRGKHSNPFSDDKRVSQITGNRKNKSDIVSIPNVDNFSYVVDFAIYHPEDVEFAVDIFGKQSTYIYISGGDVYGDSDIPYREEKSDLKSYSSSNSTGSDRESHAARKAEADRIVLNAQNNNLSAISIRPFKVYGKYDYENEIPYWINRVENYERIIVPGDGSSILHKVHVQDLVNAIQLIMEEGETGEAYNVASRTYVTLEKLINLISNSLGESVEVIHMSEHDLAFGGIHPSEFPLYVSEPTIASTEKLEALGWEDTHPSKAIEKTVKYFADRNLNVSEVGPDRENVENLLDKMT